MKRPRTKPPVVLPPGWIDSTLHVKPPSVVRKPIQRGNRRSSRDSRGRFVSKQQLDTPPKELWYCGGDKCNGLGDEACWGCLGIDRLEVSTKPSPLEQHHQQELRQARRERK